MLKKVISLFFLIFIFSGCDNDAKSEKIALEDNKIYFFYYNGCPYCHHALEYIDKKYPNLSISMVNIYNDGGYELFSACASKFKLGRNIGTPLFCMGENYLMGWSKASETEFDSYVQPFLKKGG